LLGSRTSSGERVSSSSAMTLSPYYGALRVISEDISLLPLNIFEKEDRGRKKVDEHPVAILMNERPNDEMISMAFRETLTHHAMSWFGGFAEIQKNGRGKPIALHPIHPTRVQIRRVPAPENGRGATKIVYDVKVPVDMQAEISRSQRRTINEIRFQQEDIFQIHGLGGDGITGYSVLHMAMESLGVALAYQTYSATFFGNGSTINGILQHPETLDDEKYKRLRKTWEEVHKGPHNAHRIAILEQGMEWKQTGIHPKDAQLLEERNFSVEEIARWFRLAPVKIGHNQNVPFANLESLNNAHTNEALMPWMVRWEKEIKRKLLTNKKEFAKHNVNALLRGDMDGRSKFLSTMVNNGMMTINEAREKEDLNPSSEENADKLFKPLNMAPINEFENGPPPPPAPVDNNLSPKDKASPRQEFIKQIDNSKAIFTYAAKMCVNKEIKAISRCFAKYMNNKDMFENKIRDFYEQQEGVIGQNFEPILMFLTKSANNLGLLGLIKKNNPVANYPFEYSEKAFARVMGLFPCHNFESFEENILNEIVTEMMDRAKNIVKEEG